MFSLKIENQDLLVGLEMLLGAPHIREEWKESLKTEAPELHMTMVTWNLGNARLAGPDDSPKFMEASVCFMEHTLLLIGSLWSAYGRHFPSVSKEVIDKVLEDGLAGERLEGEVREASEETWEAFMGSSIEIGLHGFGRSMIVVLGAAFLRAAKLQSEGDVSLALAAVEQNLLADKAD